MPATARSSACTTWRGTSSPRRSRIPSSRRRSPPCSSPGATPCCSTSPPGAATACSARRATTRRARRSSRWRPSAGSAIPGGPAAGGAARLHNVQKRGHDRGGGLGAPGQGRAERLDARRPRGPAVAGARTFPCHSALRIPHSPLTMTIYPLVLHLGPLSLTGYGIMMMVAFLMAGWTIQLDLRQRGLDEEDAADIVLAAVVGRLVGAKLWYVLLTGEWDALFRRGGVVV